jgi:hypothetical protein
MKRDARALLSVDSLLRLAGGLGVVALAFALSVAPCPAQEAELPDAATILDKNIEAAGGAAAFDALKNRVTRGKMAMPAMGLEGSIVQYQAPPNLSSSHIELAGMMTADEGTNGEIAWEITTMTGPRLREGEEAEIFMRRSTFPEHRWRERYSAATTVGVETIDGRDCYKVVMTPKVGPEDTWYFDKETSLLRRMDVIEKSPMGEVPATATFGDHKVVDGILIPHSSTMTVGPVEMTITLESVEHNTEIPAGTFEPPDAVKALLEPAAEAAPAEEAEAAEREEEAP